jgi:hypothetical protein
MMVPSANATPVHHRVRGHMAPGCAPRPHTWPGSGARGRVSDPSTGGNYINFQLAEDDTARTAAAYGRNDQRHQRLKAKYDPENVFRVNRNISPAR